MESEKENGFDILDRRLKLKGCNKMTADFHSKANNSFIYVYPKTLT